uniref:Reverse transcriptase domain-containing protein n=1 Tax=Panagrolaimus superbus TaxID=310955 RepID=A0A914Z1M2_9BILA
MFVCKYCRTSAPLIRTINQHLQSKCFYVDADEYATYLAGPVKTRKPLVPLRREPVITRSRSNSFSTPNQVSQPLPQTPVMAMEIHRLNSIIEVNDNPCFLPELSETSSSSSSSATSSPSSKSSFDEQFFDAPQSPFANHFAERIVSSVVNEEPDCWVEPDAWVDTVTNEEPEQINHQPLNINEALEDPLVAFDPTPQNFNSCFNIGTFEKLHDSLIIQLQELQENTKKSQMDRQKDKEQTQDRQNAAPPPRETSATFDAQRSQSPRTAFMQRRSSKKNVNKHSFKSSKYQHTKADYQKLQGLYRVNRKKAFNQIVQDSETKTCEIEENIVVDHFKNVYAKSDRQPTPPPECVPDYPHIDEDDSNPLGTAFTTSEVYEALKKCTNSAPGPDSITYATIKKYDPSASILTAVFNAVKRLKHIPQAWNTSSTILIFKKGDASDIKNWRPIALSNTLSKLYASTIAKRIQSWAIRNKVISSSQKGFMPFEGCLEHSFEIQTIIQHAKRNRKEAVIAWLDLYNAFGNLPHSSLFQTLEMAGLASETIKEIKLLYAKCETTIRLPSGPSESILIESGVKQGCPLSPILFNIAMEPLIRAIENGKAGYTINKVQHSSKTFADDLCSIARGVLYAQRQMNFATSVANWLGIKFNANKCSTLHIRSNKVIKTQFKIQGENMEMMDKETSYNYLGVPTGFKIFPSASETIEQLKREVKAIDKSLLAPWQKFDAINTFITTKLSFHLKCGTVPKKPLNELDALIKKVSKKWLNLPVSATCDLLYLPYNAGGMNIIPTSILADISTVSHAFRLLTSNDRTTQKLALDTMKEVVEKRLKKEPTLDEIAEFYNGASSQNIPLINTDVASCWTKLRGAMRRLSSKMKIVFQPDPDKKKFNLIINKAAATRFAVEAQLRDATRNHFKQSLLSKQSQGRVYNVTAKMPVSNHFYRNGNFTRFTEWNFIHRARLNLVPLNGGTKKWVTKDQSCRKCKYPCETLQHVLNNCKQNLPTMTKRHNAVVDRLMDGFKERKKKSQEILLDEIIPITASTLRPDISIIDKQNKEVILVDVTIPFENLPEAFVKARERKIEKYDSIKKELENQGYNVFLDAFIL